ncbi:1-deoxy-D-xylulose-5-phosphate synthase [bacterium]|nr:1-deoxy-D-xylulose-5-phosphate synthase [bacterium]
MATLLENIKSPSDLKSLQTKELIALCAQIRDFYIETISKTGGHFAAGLGVVELSVALHYVFDTPHDRVVWDVGHQAYVHKILTGRAKDLATMRTLNGISGFPKRSESEYDTFGTGHASTAISAALGMAIGSQLKGQHLTQHIAVVGDGALTGGLAFEGLNNAGVSNANLLIVLNDNSISIDHAVGALSQNLDAGQQAQARNLTRGIADGRTKRPKTASYFKEKGIKATNLSPKDFFEALNLHYHGPIDGHDLPTLINTLQELKAEKGPRILHIKTVKGKGYLPAEENQVTWHSPGKFDKLTGKIIKPKKSGNEPLKYQEVFGRSLVELAENNSQIVAITPAMPSGSSVNYFMEKFPERAYDVGIAEEHAVTFAAGLATEQMVPFCIIYSTFLQRAYDQVIHDVCLQNLPVVFCIDRAGIVGQDGPTHHGLFDIAYLRIIPNLVVSAAANERELRNLMFTAMQSKQPFAIRYPRGSGELVEWQTPFEPIALGKGQVLHEGENVAVVALGNRVAAAEKAIALSGRNITLVNMRFVKPLDEDLLHHLATNHEAIITVEDGVVTGGMGSAVLEFLARHGYQLKTRLLGFPDEFVPHGSPSELYKLYGVDEIGIAKTINEVI